MNKILSIYKPYGFTPLQMIEKLRQQFPEYEKETIGYAGRLDPLAHGVLLLMIGDATKERDNYLSLPKHYEFTALFGIQTDTYDLLGIPVIQSQIRESKNLKETIDSFIKNHLGKHMQTYPPYSSKAVDGKPLFWWAKENKLDQIILPQREIEIKSFEKLSSGEMTRHELNQKIDEALDQVTGDFRQEEIRKAWDKFFRDQRAEPYFITANFRIACSSGTYIRSLVNEMGAVAIDILRIQVGKYTMGNLLRLK